MMSTTFSFLLTVAVFFACTLAEEWTKGLTLGSPQNGDPGNQYLGESIDIGVTAFNAKLYENSPYIIKRECASCNAEHQLIFYRRMNSDNFDVYNVMKSWTSPSNHLYTTFNLYSTLDDALADSNRWTYCNFDDPPVGAFRDCGKNGNIGSQWTGPNNGNPALFSIYSAVQCTCAANAAAIETVKTDTNLRIDNLIAFVNTEGNNLKTYTGAYMEDSGVLDYAASPNSNSNVYASSVNGMTNTSTMVVAALVSVNVFFFVFIAFLWMKLRRLQSANIKGARSYSGVRRALAASSSENENDSEMENFQ